MKKVGFIGYGLRASTLMNAVKSLELEMKVVGILDPREVEIKKQIEEDPYFTETVFYSSVEELLDGADLDGVFICTRCGLHTEMACKVLRKGIPVFLEKPVAITKEQLKELTKVRNMAEGKVTVSFPLRETILCREVKKIVDRGDLGEITMVQAVNNVPYGSVYYHSWYREEHLTGGLFLQKMTHDIDYITYLTGLDVTETYAKAAKLYYKGERPQGLHCPACNEYHSCIESSYMVKHMLKEEPTGDACCFAVDTGNMDVGSVIFTLENGALISYNQNFIVKKSAARRGCRIIGTKACVEFDFYTGEIRLDSYQTEQTTVTKFTTQGNHFGGDEALVYDFYRIMSAQSGKCSLMDGIKSAAVCLAAKQSCESGIPVLVSELYHE